MSTSCQTCRRKNTVRWPGWRACLETFSVWSFERLLHLRTYARRRCGRADHGVGQCDAVLLAEPTNLPVPSGLRSLPSSLDRLAMRELITRYRGARRKTSLGTFRVDRLPAMRGLRLSRIAPEVTIPSDKPPACSGDLEHPRLPIRRPSTPRRVRSSASDRRSSLRSAIKRGCHPFCAQVDHADSLVADGFSPAGGDPRLR